MVASWGMNTNWSDKGWGQGGDSKNKDRKAWMGSGMRPKQSPCKALEFNLQTVFQYIFYFIYFYFLIF